MIDSLALVYVLLIWLVLVLVLITAVCSSRLPYYSNAEAATGGIVGVAKHNKQVSVSVVGHGRTDYFRFAR